MTFISTTQHQAFCKAVKQELAKAGDGSTLMEQNLARFLKDMEQLHTDYLHHLQAIAIRHPHIRNHQRRWRGAKFFECIAHVLRGSHLPAPPPKIGFERHAHGGLIVHD